MQISFVYIRAQVVLIVRTRHPLSHIVLNQELNYQLRCVKEKWGHRQQELHACTLLWFTIFEEILLYFSMDAEHCCSIFL